MYVHYGLLACAILAIGLGLFMLVQPDMMWKFTCWRNRASGIKKSERTATWERLNRIGGVFVILIGVGTGIGFWQVAQIVAEEETRRERARDLPPPNFELDLGRPLKSQ